MRLLYGAPTPLDAPVVIRSSQESSIIMASARDSTRDVSLAGLLPTSIDGIARAINTSVDVAHLAMHASAEAVEIEQRSGAKLHVSPRVLAGALAEIGASLIVLNGCETEEIGRYIQDQSESAVIATTGYLPDEVCISFVGVFYPLLFVDGDIKRSFQRAIDLTKEVNGYAPYHLFESDHENVYMQAGFLSVEKSFVLARARAAAHDITSRTGELFSTYALLEESSCQAIHVQGPPLSGVSTFLRAVDSQYSWMFDQGSTAIDLGTTAAHSDATAKSDSNFTIESALHQAEKGATLLLFDHFDRLDEPAAANVLQKIENYNLHENSKVVLGGGSSLPGSTRLKIVEVALAELSIDAAVQMLTDHLGARRAERLRNVVARIPRLPGRLLTLVSDVKNGAADQDLDLLIQRGDTRAGLNRIVKNTIRDRSVRLLVRCMTYSGSRVPRAAIKEAFSRVRSRLSGGRVDNLEESFEEAVAILRSSRMLWVEEGQNVGRGMPESYFLANPDFLRIAAIEGPSVSPAERAECVETLASNALARVQEQRLSIQLDLFWVTSVVQQCRSAGLLELGAKLGLQLLDRHGVFRLAGASIDFRPLAEAAFSAAREIGEIDSASQIGLVLGESYYHAGDLDSAEQTFRQCLALPSTSGRKLQAMRALGQVSYRRGKYTEALALYENAFEYETDSPPNVVATLRHQKGKALFRLGRFHEAVEELSAVLIYRRESGDFRATLRVQHELGRVMQAAGDLEKAAELFHLVVLGAESGGFEKLLVQPLYQLSVLEISRGNIEAAQSYQVRCSLLAESMKDPLWRALSDLAGMMIDFAEGNYSRASERVSTVIELSRKRGYSQVIEDIQQWIRNETSSLSDLDPQEVTMASVTVAQLESISPKKAAKALRYAQEPGRISSIDVAFGSDSGTRKVHWSNGSWSCSCDLFSESSVCSHIVALSLMRGAPWEWHRAH